jgi:DNA-binding transcriptional LysR family regulator
MDIDDLKKFLVVAKESNLQSASRELHVTAGALSKVVKRLETKLGTPLFDRIGRSIVLNQMVKTKPPQ